jgi:hypothetical protein
MFTQSPAHGDDKHPGVPMAKQSSNFPLNLS